MIEFDVVVVRNFLLALCIGALVGIEREKHKTTEHPGTFGGLRTFILIAQVGAISAFLSIHLQSPWLFIIAVLAIAVVLMAAYVLENRQQPVALGLTTEISAITVCLLGGAVMYGYPELAVVLAILTSAILTFKQPLHGLVSKLDTTDLYAGTKLLLATFIVLPLLPDQTLYPWLAINPYKLWLLVVLISALSLLGYVAVRLLGPARGTAVAGLAGGLVSSTAVTMSMARQSKVDGDASDKLACGILLAWLVMFGRVMVMVALVYLPLLPLIWLPFTLMLSLTAGLAGYFYWRGSQQLLLKQQQDNFTNPFSLWAASKFALLFALVLVAVKITEMYAPQQGMYLLAAVAGMTDVDAITLSMTELARQSNQLSLAATAILIAALSNTLIKGILVMTLGAPLLRQKLMYATGIILAGGFFIVLLV